MAGDDVLSRAELVGRERECAVVRGEAGIGKTALLGYAAARATDMRVLRATGVEAEHDLAFAGLHGLLWPIIDELPCLPEPQRAALSGTCGRGC